MAFPGSPATTGELLGDGFSRFSGHYRRTARGWLFPLPLATLATTYNQWATAARRASGESTRTVRCYHR
jgi:hypothetical protein